MHIRSKDNYVADILTRGATPDKIVSGSDWQNGPKWLVDDPKKWPISLSSTLAKEERDIVKSFERVTKSFLSNATSRTGYVNFPSSILNMNNCTPTQCLESHPLFTSELSDHKNASLITKSSIASVTPQPSDIHIFDSLINGSLSLNRIVRSSAFILRLQGRRNNMQFCD